MQLKELLTSMLHQVDGGYAVMLMGYDCIAIDEVISKDLDFDVQAIVVQFGTVINEIRNATDLLGAGEMEESIITTTNARVVVRVLSDEFFAAFVLARQGNLGKARFVLRSKALQLVETVG